MALPHKSLATIHAPEFINLQPLDVNPLMSKCEIKVLYIGENRNRSFISKEVATDMAKTLRGCPIVGYYKQQKEDFADHGEQLILDDEGIHFNCLTKPYGFVAPDAKVWFQKFNDSDDFGNEIERQYLMTTGYLWTGQFEEAQSVFQDEGKPQSMELDEETLDGHWSTNIKNNIEFFIINDAIFSKLCILGDEVEPCFEGASISKPDVSANFSMVSDTDFNDFKKTLFSMMKELSEALKGGNGMEQKENTSEVEATFTEEQNLSEPAVESTLENDLPTEAETDFSEDSQVVEQQLESEPEAEFAKDEEEKEEKEDSTEEEEESKEEDKDDEEKKYSLLEQQYNDLSVQYEQLKLENAELISFKNQVEDERKDALINEFYMLSEEDKKEVIENKAKYSLEEIKAKLSVICYDKKVNFNSDNSEKIDSSKKKEEEIITYSYDNEDASLPDWVKAVKNNI